MRILATEADIADGVAALVACEPRFRSIVDRHGLPALRRSDDGFKGLLRIVTDQLISLQAAEAIWQRVEAKLSPFDPGRVARMRTASLMALGLSGAKARSFRAIARATTAGTLDFPSLHRLPDEDVIAVLTALDGVGRWTAMIYLLSAMGRADAWPVGDLAVELAAQDLFGLSERPEGRRSLSLAEPWRPHRAIAARLLWSHYRGLKGMSQRLA